MDNTLTITIDVEWKYDGDNAGHLDLTAFSALSLRQRTDMDNGRTLSAVEKILDLLRSYKQRITFFVLAELDEAFPSLVADIVREGHEVGLHGLRHDLLTTAEALDDELRRCKPFKDRYDCVSFRAPRIGGTAFLYPLLCEHGYKFDSSVYGTGRFREHGITVVPVSVLPLRNDHIRRVPCDFSAALKKFAIPFGSGAAPAMGEHLYVRTLDYYTKRFAERPCIFLHSWQLDHPQYSKRFLAQNPGMIFYSRRSTALFEHLCRRYRFAPMREAL